MVGRARSAGALHRPQHGDARRHHDASKQRTSGTTRTIACGTRSRRRRIRQFTRRGSCAAGPDRQLSARPALLRQLRLPLGPGRAWTSRRTTTTPACAWHDGKLEAVVNAKVHAAGTRAGALVDDIERGFRDGIEPLPWQTDTCIGDWHYNRSLFDNHQYKSATTVIHRLCDIVSKNGNLLLSHPPARRRHDRRRRAQDPRRIADWMGRNSEAIHGTRPWRTFGEGPTRVAGGMFSEHTRSPLPPRTSASRPRAARSMPSRLAGRRVACCASRVGGGLGAGAGRDRACRGARLYGKRVVHARAQRPGSAAARRACRSDRHRPEDSRTRPGLRAPT